MAGQRTDHNRRELLMGLLAAPAAAILPRVSRAQAARAPTAPPGLEELLNIADFEAAARAVLPPAHFGYLATGIDDDRTVAWNHDAYGQLEISVRRFSDVSRTELGIDLFGMRWPSPVYLSAVSAQRAFHPEAELATARAAATRSALMMLSAAGSTGPEDVMAARGGPVWQQIYPTDDWEVARAVIERAQRAGCSAIVLTVDAHWPRYNEALVRAMRSDPRTCTNCHVNNSHDFVRKAPIYQGIDVSRVKESTQPSALTWEYLDRVRKLVKGRLLIKGIMRGDEAEDCVRHGADGVIVSNHGGRDEESLRSTIETLPEVVAACRGRVPVLVDGGIRRGTDVFKALALGASAVGVGRPQIWGLAPYGQAGVEAVLDIYMRELRAIMRQAGTPSVASITRDFVVARAQAPR
ncbi:MAG TPA: alpha-hydroxy acid oxidase [Acetobacteraceae bacterium]|nr:alpha-hydroxy acid oxidase [Acetobacteraceae bacterium]